MSNYYGKIELPQKYSYQGNEHYLSSEKSDAYIWLADENTKQANEIKRLQEQLEEAQKVIKLYAEMTFGHKQKDGTYGMWICSGEMAWENPLDRIKSRMDYICYDPRPAKDYLEKWGEK